jgi:hypothetical protein
MQAAVSSSAPAAVAATEAAAAGEGAKAGGSLLRKAMQGLRGAWGAGGRAASAGRPMLRQQVQRGFQSLAQRSTRATPGEVWTRAAAASASAGSSRLPLPVPRQLGYAATASATNHVISDWIFASAGPSLHCSSKWPHDSR